VGPGHGLPVAHRPQLRAMSFKTIRVGFPQGGLSLFQSAFQQTKRRQPALDGEDKFPGRNGVGLHRSCSPNWS